MEKKLEDIQAKKQVLEKVLKEKNAKANTLQEEVYVLKERLSNAQTVHKRELETERQKVCCSYIIHATMFLRVGIPVEPSIGGFSRYVIAAMLVDENTRFLINSFCSSTSNCRLQYCYLWP